MVPILVLLIALDLVIYVLAIKFILPVFEARRTIKAKKREKMAAVETFTVTTKDGISIRGGIFPCTRKKPKGLILYFPEYGGDFWSAGYYCKGLIDAGFKVVSFDFRNQGQSQFANGYTPLHWLTEYELNDAETVMNYIEQREDLSCLPLGLFGTSRGASACLEIARLNPKVKGIAADGAFSFYSLVTHYSIMWADRYVPAWFARMIPVWRLRFSIFLIKKISEFKKGCKYINIDRNLSKLKDRNVFLITGQRDSYVPLHITQAIKDRIHSDKTDLWVAPKAKHNQSRDQNTEEFDRRITRFFDKAFA